MNGHIKTCQHFTSCAQEYSMPLDHTSPFVQVGTVRVCANARSRQMPSLCMSKEKKRMLIDDLTIFARQTTRLRTRSLLDNCMLLSVKSAVIIHRDHLSAIVLCQRNLNHRSRSLDPIPVSFVALALSSLSLGSFLELCCLSTYLLGRGDGRIEDNAPSEIVQECPYQVHCALVKHCQRVADVCVKVQPLQKCLG